MEAASITIRVPDIGDHGGALARAEACFGRPEEGWLDLSTGINPWPYPVPAIPARAWTRLPDDGELARLLAAAARCYGARDASTVVAAPGSQALIQCLPRLFPAASGPLRVAVVGPTYAEHARCWQLAGHAVQEHDALPDAAGADVAVVTNPNNPDGRRQDPERLLRLADELASRNGLLVVDEAFADVAPDISLAGQAGREGMCVLRSFGKFFGLAGIRLGFALGPAALVRHLGAVLGPWAVAGPAIEIGAAALADEGWAAAMRVNLAAAARDLDRLRDAHGLAVVGGTDLYRLVRTGQAGRLHEALG
ncbi:MAG TPA: threonine-phosphate decarboxylase CobD, partial [Arenibaculum sp.]|nr:threonine-phosphate decarboxylase CobD [Arenibaculum sp.]